MSSHPHHHHGHDQHPAASAHDVVQANREFFEGEGKGRSIMKTEDALRGAQSSAEAIRAAVGSLEGLDVLDFACGPGNVSKILVSECKSITGLDISKDFVNDFNADAASLGVQDKMFAKCVDISENPDALEGAKYDLIFSVTAYHHLPSPADMTKVLAQLLKPSGRLLIVDGFASPEDPHAALFGESHKHVGSIDAEKIHQAVPHKHGFSSDEMKDMFTSAGLEFVSYDRSFDLLIFNRVLPMFVAIGKKID